MVLLASGAWAAPTPTPSGSPSPSPSSSNNPCDLIVGLARDYCDDAICNYLFEGTPIFPGPHPAQLNAPADGEEAVLAWMENSRAWLQPRPDARRLKAAVTGRWNRFTRRLKNRLRPIKNRLTG